MNSTLRTPLWSNEKRKWTCGGQRLLNSARRQMTWFNKCPVTSKELLIWPQKLEPRLGLPHDQYKIMVLHSTKVSSMTLSLCGTARNLSCYQATVLVVKLLMSPTLSCAGMAASLLADIMNCEISSLGCCLKSVIMYKLSRNFFQWPTNKPFTSQPTLTPQPGLTSSPQVGVEVASSNHFWM